MEVELNCFVFGCSEKTATAIGMLADESSFSSSEKRRRMSEQERIEDQLRTRLGLDPLQHYMFIILVTHQYQIAICNVCNVLLLVGV